MKIQIEEYRGWSISFDTDKESFYCHSDNYDRDQIKQSYLSTKKWIDDFIKDNEKFKPIWIEAKPSTYVSYQKIKLIGIRKDGRFIFEDEKGNKKQLSDHQEKDYVLLNPDNYKYRKEAELIDLKIEELRLKRNAILKNVSGVELVDYKKQILG